MATLGLFLCGLRALLSLAPDVELCGPPEPDSHGLLRGHHQPEASAASSATEPWDGSTRPSYSWAELQMVEGSVPNSVSFKTVTGEYLTCRPGLQGRDARFISHADGTKDFFDIDSFVIENDSSQPDLSNVRAKDSDLYLSVLSMGLRCARKSEICADCVQMSIRHTSSKEGDKVNFVHKGSAMFVAFGTAIFPTIPSKVYPNHSSLLQSYSRASQQTTDARGDLLKVVKGLAWGKPGVNKSIVPPYPVVSLKVAGAGAESERYIRHFEFKLAAETDGYSKRNPALWRDDTSFYMVPLENGAVAFAPVNYPWLWMGKRDLCGPVSNLDVIEQKLGFHLYSPKTSLVDECMLQTTDGRGDVVIHKYGGLVSRLQLRNSQWSC